ncbi:MAG TPA: AraC family transcriptional regulator [Lachnospiraceae bacterium]|nr:AraC family transcriptional regulator [Lachnospiraceae bacterium]
MAYFTEIRTAIVFVENHIYDSHIDYGELERAIGFSHAHIRDIFSRSTGMPLMRYVQERKINNSAFDLLHSDLRVLDIAMKYGFENHETYSRAFKKVIGITPNEYRKKRFAVGKSKLASGDYGLSILDERQVVNVMNSLESSKESTVLYGVPKVEYGMNCTPYPLCLKSCATYLGEDIDYSYAMVASGAAFRFTWNRECWDLSNVDIFHAMNDTNEIYSIGAKALGRSFEFLERTDRTTKEEFITFITKHIDAGLPCIALGIIGPPEACIITGYRDKGDTLLGWNFFQSDPGFGANVSFDESGYFITDKWWENTDTQAVMCMGEVISDKKPLKEIVEYGNRILTGREQGTYAKGLNAYDAWKNTLLSDRISESSPMALLFERRMCIDDALSSLLDGRGNASRFFSELGDKSLENKEELYEIAIHFDNVFKIVMEMVSVLGGWEKDEATLKRLADRKVIDDICKLIDKAKGEDSKAWSALVHLGAILDKKN